MRIATHPAPGHKVFCCSRDAKKVSRFIAEFDATFARKRDLAVSSDWFAAPVPSHRHLGQLRGLLAGVVFGSLPDAYEQLPSSRQTWCLEGVVQLP